ncbi:MAG: AAA-like domain protein [Pelotomaculum sp. PtaU1.Bin065]|nr:MAG: AAA-like domain protein [Pelotomaculum sp. PtaU1.Bin065]
MQTDYKKLLILIIFVAALFILPVTVAGLTAFLVIRYLSLPWKYVAGICVTALLALLIWPKVFVLPGIGAIYHWIMLSNDKAMFKLIHRGVQSVVVTDPVAWMYAPWRVVISAIATGIPAGALAAYLHGSRKINSSQEKENQQNFENSSLNSYLIERAEKKYLKTASRTDGVYLGIDWKSKKQVIITRKELNQHILLCGTTGTGKTTTMMNFMEYALRAGWPLVTIDGKGDPGLVHDIKSLAFDHRRQVQVFSLSDPDNSAHYNPIKNGGPTEIKDRLMAMTEWSEPHFQYMAERYLQTAINIHCAAGTLSDLPGLVAELTPSRLLSIARSINAPPQIIDYLSTVPYDQVGGLVNRLSVLTESQVGYLFTDLPHKTIILDDVIENRGVAIFSLDSLSFALYASLLGKLVINDLKSCAARRYAKAQSYDDLVLTVYDEFNVFASRQVVDFINKSRGAGFAALISIQSLADLDTVDNALNRQVVANVNTYVIQRQNTGDDAEQLAAVVGTENTWEEPFKLIEFPRRAWVRKSW